MNCPKCDSSNLYECAEKSIKLFACPDCKNIFDANKEPIVLAEFKEANTISIKLT